MMILTLDVAGTPAKWVPLEKAAYYKAKGLVTWELGETAHRFMGGTNAHTGLQSSLDIKAIQAIAGAKHVIRDFKAPPFNRLQLFRRDRGICGYCGDQFKESDLTVEHVHPESRGGALSWMNTVAACGACNFKKNDRTPEEAGMPLLYVPYVPNRWEAFILDNRAILADQMDFLLQGVSKQSRQRH